MINRTPSQPTQPQKADRDSLMPCSIVFLSGRYKGKALNLGVAIAESSHSQSSTWEAQDGRSVRIGSTFKNVDGRKFQISLQFYSIDKDISEQVENVYTLQEIDEQTGLGPTLLYQEGDIKVAPVVVNGSISVKKQHPFPGSKGFHYAEMQIPLELLGGKASEHRFAKPLVETELTRAAAKETQAEREKQGTIAVIDQFLATCLSAQDNQELKNLLQGDKLTQPAAVAGLSSSAFIQAAVAGLIPKSVLSDPSIRAKLQRDLAAEMAAKTDGASSYTGALANAIRGQTAVLPADLQAAVPNLQENYLLLQEAIVGQELSDRSFIFNNPSTANQLISIAGCGVTMRGSGATSVQTQVSPESQRYFDSKLGALAGDSSAQARLILDEINKMLADKSVTDADVRSRFGLSSDEQVRSLRNAVPFLSKDQFVQRFRTGVEGLASWASLTDYLASSDSSLPLLPGM